MGRRALTIDAYDNTSFLFAHEMQPRCVYAARGLTTVGEMSSNRSSGYCQRHAGILTGSELSISHFSSPEGRFDIVPQKGQRGWREKIGRLAFFKPDFLWR